MAENIKPRTKKSLFEEFCYVYLMYFDEARGHMPLLIYPSEKLIEDKKFMRPIKYHSIWFLSVEEQDAFDHIDLEYKNFTFMGKKFFTKSKRKKRRAGLDEETAETIVIIVSLPIDIEIFGDGLIQDLTEEIRNNYEDKFSTLISSVIAKEEIIKTPKIRKIVEEGNEIKEGLRNLIAKIGDNYFSRIVINQTDSTSIKKQKAISYLYLKGIDYESALSSEAFSDIKLFGTGKANNNYAVKSPFTITKIHKVGDSQELEILVKKKTEEDFDDLTIKISHVKDFFEKEVMSQSIDLWFQSEEILFVTPIIPHINEYLFFIVDNKNKKNLLLKKIDLDMLN